MAFPYVRLETCNGLQFWLSLHYSTFNCLTLLFSVCHSPTQVRTVPGLDCIYRLRLDHASVLGFKWSFGPDASVAAATSACSLDGQLVLAGPSNEIARVLVVQVG